MHLWKAIGFGMALCVGAFATTGALASPILTVGTENGGGNTFPFSAGPTSGLTIYQQSYSATAFPNSISFNTISFDKYSANGNPMDTGTYIVSFYIAGNGFDNLTTDFSSNEGIFLGTLGTFDVGGLMPSTLSLTGSTINYNPLEGDLLMVVDVSNGASFNGTGNASFEVDHSGSYMTREFDNAYKLGGDDEGLVTTFSMGALAGAEDISAVPEPSSLPLMLAGMGLIAGALYFGAGRLSDKQRNPLQLQSPFTANRAEHASRRSFGRNTKSQTLQISQSRQRQAPSDKQRGNGH